MTPKKISLALFALALALAGCQAGSSPNAETGEISGGVYCDLNGDGECDCPELGFADVRIHLHAETCDGQILRSVLTADDGSFLFTEVEPGQYCVFADIQPMCGGAAGYSLTSGVSRVINVRAGWVHEIVWFGLTPLLQPTATP